MIVDASAIVAIMADEPDADILVDRLRQAELRLTHPVSVYEATTAMCRLNRISVERAKDDVDEFLQALDLRVVALEDMTASAAVQAFSRYGKGRHPAKLNMGDCFSYACAKLRGMPLLYKGDDFAKTDLA